MSVGFDKIKVRCGECGDRPKEGSHLSYLVTTRMHLCDKCRKIEKPNTDVPEPSDQNSRMCDEHSDRIVDLFCNTCKREICMMCGMTSHSSHEKDELKKVIQKRQHDDEERLKDIKIKEDEWCQFQKFADKSIARNQQHFQTVRQSVNTSTGESQMKIENTRQQKEDKIRKEAQVKIEEIERLKEAQLNCNNIEAKKDEERVQKAKDNIMNKLSVLQDASTTKTKAVVAALHGPGVAKSSGQAKSLSVPGDETREWTLDDSIPSPNVTMKAMEQLGSHVDQIVWAVSDHKDKLRENNLVSTIWTLKQEYPLNHDPWPCSYVGGDTVVFIDVASGSVHAMNLQNGESKPISQGKGNYTDCVSNGKHILTCENTKTELQYEAHLSQIDLDEASTNGTPIVLDYKTDEPVAVYAAENKKGVLMVAYDGADSIIKVKGHLGTPGNNLEQKTIGLKKRKIGIGSKKIGGKLHATPAGKFVVDTGPAEFTVINEYGTEDATIYHKEWDYALCGTDPLDDILYVSYQPEGSDIVKMDEVALDGTIIRKGVLEYKVEGKLVV